MMIFPDWPAPANIRAATTTRMSGNIAMHVNDDPILVLQNRAMLMRELELPNEPLWLDQKHTTTLICADDHFDNPPVADASYSVQPGHVCVVMTADCLPILICNKQGTLVSAIHAGWRGLANGVLLKTLEQLPAKQQDLLVWLGPGIGKEAFEVGEDVRNAFLSQNTALPEHFADFKPGKYLCDMDAIARFQLSQKNIHTSYGGGYCTYTDRDRFYSYRRDGDTGRMATLIWMEPP